MALRIYSFSPSGGGGAASSFTIIQTDFGTFPTATGPNDVLTLTSSDGSLTITGNSANDTVDFKVVGAGGSGSVTSVGLTAAPSIFNVFGSPVMSAGTLGLSLNVQAANKFWGGPISGAASTPTFRPIGSSDLPTVIFPQGITGVLGLANLPLIPFPTGLTNTGGIPFGITTIHGLTLGLNQILDINTAGVSSMGALGFTDFNIFNSKQASGAYITGLTGGVFATGPGVAGASVGVGQVNDTQGSLANKPALTVVATSNQALTGVPVNIDGITVLIDGSTILLTAQSSGSENGPWVIHSGAWTRPTWYPPGGTTQAFQFITTLIRLGTTYQGTTWRMTTAGAVTIDTTATTWVVTPLALNTNTVTGVLPIANTPLIPFPTGLTNTGAIPFGITTQHGLTLSATQILDIGLAGISQIGALGFTDFNVFNNKQAALPWTTPGDIVYLGLAGTPVRLPIGLTTQVLGIGASVLPVWATSASGSNVGVTSVHGLTLIGTNILDIQTADQTHVGVITIGGQTLAGFKSFLNEISLGAALDLGLSAVLVANTNIDATHNVVQASAAGGSIVLTLPTAVGITGRRYKFIRTDSTVANNIQIVGTSAQTIGGFASEWLLTQTSSLEVISDGANWQTLDANRVPYIVTSTTDTLTAATINTTETAFAGSFVFPANYFELNRKITATIGWLVTSSGTPVTMLPRLRFQKAGPTNVVLASSPAQAPASNLTNQGAGNALDVCPVAALGAAASIETSIFASSSNVPAFLRNSATAGVAADTTAVQTLQVTMQYGTNTAGNTTTLRKLVINFDT